MALVLTLVCSSGASGQTNTWTGVTSGALNVSSNYATGASVATDGNPAALFVFGNNAANRYSLTNGAEFKVNRFEFTGTNSYTLANTGLFNFVGAGNGITQSSSANQTVSGGIKISDGPLTFGGNGTGLVTFSGTGSDFAGKGVTKSGTSAFLITQSIASPGTVTINGGTLAFSGTGNLASAYQLRGGVIAQSGTFTRTVGTAVTSVNFAAGSNGGFAAYGGALNVQTNLGTWGTTANSLTATSQLILGSSIADNVVTLSSALNLGTAARTINLVDNANSASDAAAISGLISGALGGLNLTGAGTLTLSAANTYTGVTTIGSGVTLAVATINNGSTAGNLGQATNAAANLVLGGGTLRYTGATASSNRAFTLTAGTTSNIDVSTQATSLTLSGASASTTGALTKTGLGTLVLTGANAHSGTTTVSAGTLTLGVANALAAGAVTVAGGTLGIGNFSDSVGAVTLTSGSITGGTGVLTGTSYALDGAGDTSISAILGGAGAFSKTGEGIATLSGNNTRSGTTTINAGVLSVGTIGDGGVAGNLGAASSLATNLVLGGGTLRYTGTTATTNRAFTLTATTASGFEVTSAATALTLTGASAATTGGLTKTGAGILILSAANAHTGATTISTGTLQVGNAGTTGSLSASSAITNNAALSFNRSNTITQGTDFGSISGTGTLTQAGSGTLVLGSGNSYSGTTTISTGILRVTNATGLGTTAAGTTVASGAALELSGGISIGAETLSLAGSGIDSGGALRSVSGNNSYGGAISAAVASSITVDAGVLTLNGVLNSASTTTFGGAGNVVTAGGITGGGTVIKTGAGALTLAVGNGQANTTVNGGQLNVNHLAALGTPAGTLTLAGGVLLDNTSGAAVTVANPKSISLGSSLTFLGSNPLDLGTGNVTLSGNTAINVSASELTFSGNVAGANSGITKTGAGTLRLDGLSGAGSFTGDSFVNAGRLVIGGTSTLGGGQNTLVTVADGAFLEIEASASAGNVTLVSRPDGLITTGNVVANQDFGSSGTLGPSNANFDGTVDIAPGVVIEASANYFGTIPAVPEAARIVFEEGSTLKATAGFAIDANQGILLAGGVATMEVSPSQALFIESVVAGSGGITKAGSGNMRLTGVNTYTGGTVVSAGILGITNGEALGAVSGALKLDGGTVVGAQVTSGEPISSVTIAAGRALVLANGKTSGIDAQSGLSLRYDGVIGEENGAGAAAGLRIGSSTARTGTVILGGNNTYQGATAVDFGKLILNGSTSASSAVSVASGATLAGSGTVGGNTTISSGGALAPGNSPGVLTVEGNTNFTSGSMFEWEIDTAQTNPETNRGIAYDGVNTSAVTGSGAIFKVMLTGTQDFTDGFWNQNRTWTDIFKSADGSSILTGWASVFSGGFQYAYNGQTVAPTSQGFFTTTGSSLTWSAVPEPSNLLAGMLAASALLRRRRSA